MSRLQDKYRHEVVPAMMQEFRYHNVMQVPRLQKVTLNMGMGEAVQNARAMEAATHDLETICGQHPVVTRARKSISAFRLREGMPIGLMVTLRGNRMYEFLDKFFNAVLPRIRDFRGMPTKSFDGRGNYSIGLREQLVFPEIEYDKIDKIRGLEVSIVTSARSDEEALGLLRNLGMPFSRQ